MMSSEIDDRAKVRGTVTCPECGTRLTDRARFCHACGWDAPVSSAGKTASKTGPRPAWKRWTMSVTLALSVVLVLWLLLIPRSDVDATLSVGEAAPDIMLPQADGGPSVRLADLKGKPVILNFWASWCQPCAKEMPDLQAIYDKYKDQGLQLYGVNVGESKVAVNSYRKQHDIRFPILLDLEEQAQIAYKILPIPATFFIDRSGEIRAIYQYQMSRQQMEAEANRLVTQ